MDQASVDRGLFALYIGAVLAVAGVITIGSLSLWHLSGRDETPPQHSVDSLRQKMGPIIEGGANGHIRLYQDR